VAGGTAQIEVIPARSEQEPILANLLELYAHDFSEFRDLEIAADGRFGYPHLPLYWTESNRHAFLVRTHGALAGLVLVQRDSELVWDVAEFFVLRGYRRRGIGTEVAHQVWRQFRGLWQVRVMQSNARAHQFWEQAIARFIGKTIASVGVEKDGEQWRVFSFESGP
jgi:predicted acetyltransferase